MNQKNTKTKPRVPESKIPIIGDRNKEIIQAVMQGIIQQLDPLLTGLTQQSENIEHRLAVVEEVKQIFPSKIDVNVVVKHDFSTPNDFEKAEQKQEVIIK